ncbi:LTA synthase family protein [Paenochrobactrum pullorum]|uniref:LTA synthase family protein n=1 Tax=Paenochrobactrum pullorum TaxID=1324351 RepID=UPI0035BBCD5E
MSQLFDNVKAEHPAAQNSLIYPSQLSANIKHIAGVALFSLVISTLLVFCIEWLARGSLSNTIQFFTNRQKPSWTTVLLFAFTITACDALLGRRFFSAVFIGIAGLISGAVAYQKSLYLGDPLYPSDFLYARQIVDLLPLLVRDRPFSAILIAICLVVLAIALVVAVFYGRTKFKPLSMNARVWRLVIALPALCWFGYISDFATYSWSRDRLKIAPMMWDQTANYQHNGFAIAFILNIPMAKVFAPESYSAGAIENIEVNRISGAALNNRQQPDIIVVMSESFWDPTRLPGVNFNTDPIPTVRQFQSGHIFSPEFGGMTANVEFEALTGFSKAFLPTGSIPYQQYIRGSVPSLASFFKEQGYATRAVHPFRAFFWNRGNVYQHLGFDGFMSEETLPELEKSGTLASDDAMVSEMIKEAENIDQPFFFFAVSLQGHGPYAASRYPDSKLEVTGHAPEHAREAIKAFAQGASEADASLLRLMEWAKSRERETILVFFGDHLPPLGPAYVDTGFMTARVASRTAPAAQMAREHETPLVLWSSKSGIQRETGTISPAFLPLHILNMAGVSHPFYTDFLGALHDKYAVIDNHVLFASDRTTQENWQREAEWPKLVRDYQLIQYDQMFGQDYAGERFFRKSTPQS